MEHCNIPASVSSPNLATSNYNLFRLNNAESQQTMAIRCGDAAAFESPTAAKNKSANYDDANVEKEGSMTSTCTQQVILPTYFYTNSQTFIQTDKMLSSAALGIESVRCVVGDPGKAPPTPAMLKAPPVGTSLVANRDFLLQHLPHGGGEVKEEVDKSVSTSYDSSSSNILYSNVLSSIPSGQLPPMSQWANYKNNRAEDKDILFWKRRESEKMMQSISETLNYSEIKMAQCVTLVNSDPNILPQPQSALVDSSSEASSPVTGSSPALSVATTLTSSMMPRQTISLTSLDDSVDSLQSVVAASGSPSRLGDSVGTECMKKSAISYSCDASTDNSMLLSSSTTGPSNVSPGQTDDSEDPQKEMLSDLQLQQQVSIAPGAMPDSMEVRISISDNQYMYDEMSGVRRWHCQQCSKSYTTKHNLVTHILDHSGIKPHCCVVCGKFFKQLNHLQTHMLTHEKLRPFQCHICEVTFTQSSHLKRHLMTHAGAGNSDHYCDVCDRKFAYACELKNHMIRHQKDQQFLCERQIVSGCILLESVEEELEVSLRSGFSLQNSAFLHAIKEGAGMIYAVTLPKNHRHILHNTFAYHIQTKFKEYSLPKCADSQIASNYCASLFTFVKSKYPLLQIQLPSVDCSPSPQKFIVDSNIFSISFTISDGIYLHKNLFWALGNYSDFQFIFHSVKLLNAHILLSRTNATRLMNRTIQVTHNDVSECTYFRSQLHSNTSIHRNWFRVLKKVNYEFPPIVSSQFSSSKYKHNYSLAKTEKLLQETCGRLLPTINLMNPWIIFSDIVLVIVLNNPIYQAIPFVDSLYRPFFPNIVYCGSEPLKTELHVLFVKYKSNPKGHFAGSFNYECVSLVANLNLSANGYFFLSDDISFSPYRLSKHNRNKPWYVRRAEIIKGDIENLRECNFINCTFRKPRWMWWNIYKNAVLSTLEELERKTGIVSKQCHSQLVSLTGGRRYALGGSGDIYYIPKSYISKFQAISELFLKNHVFLEIAVPTILHCLTKRKDDIEELKGLVMWDGNRNSPWKNWKFELMFDKIYIHPTKWSKLSEQRQSSTAFNLTKQFYCRQILPWMHCGLDRNTMI